MKWKKEEICVAIKYGSTASFLDSYDFVFSKDLLFLPEYTVNQDETSSNLFLALEICKYDNSVQGKTMLALFKVEKERN